MELSGGGDIKQSNICWTDSFKFLFKMGFWGDSEMTEYWEGIRAMIDHET